MFNTRFESENSIELLVLEDTAAHTSVAVIPKTGAMLHRFEVQHEGARLNVIDNYPDRQVLETQLESTGFKSAKLSPFVCRLQEGKYKFAGKEYKVDKFYLSKHALHGIIYDAPFEVAAHGADGELAFMVLKYRYMGTDRGYPFFYQCEVRYELRKNNELTISTTVTNTGEGLIPICDGWHPYFTFGGSVDDLQLEFQSLQKVEFNNELIPTGKLLPYDSFNSLKKLGDAVFDDCFELNFATCQPMLVLRDPVQKIQLEIRPSESYPYLQIYTPDTRQSIAIENLSSAPDAFNNGMGLVTLEPGGKKTFITNYRIK
jgi:aldose 1-epimerase